MKERPILFNAEMVKAILEGRKTQTSRLLKVQPPVADKKIMPLYQVEPMPKVTEVSFHEVLENNIPHCSSISRCKCPFGKIGDHLWVRETFLHIDDTEDKLDGMGSQTYYKASTDTKSDRAYMEKHGLKWKPSIHMPRSACRLVLEITNVRVERLQDITKEDAKAEGFDYSTHPSAIEMGYAIGAKTNFRFTWEEIYGQSSWNQNPWVWVVEFKVIEGARA